MRTGGIVLCGGQSTRMGIAKAWLPFGPELMLQRVVRSLAEVFQSVVVVAAADQELPPLAATIRVARDRRPDRGPMEGLHAGLSLLADEVDAAYVTSCDVPRLVPGFVEQLLKLLDSYDVVVPVEGKFHHPLSAVYRASVLPRVRELLDADRLRPVFLYQKVSTRRVPVDELRPFDPELHTLANLNDPAQYFEALRCAGYEPPDEIVRRLRDGSA